EAADSPRARAQAGPSATMIFHDLAEQEELGSLGFKLPPQFQAQLNAYRAIYGSYQPPDARYLSNHRGHLMFLRPEEQVLITPYRARASRHPGAPVSIKLSRHPSARRGIWFPYVLGASPSVISISVPQGSVMYTIRRPDAFVLLRIAASVLMPAA